MAPAFNPDHVVKPLDGLNRGSWVQGKADHHLPGVLPVWRGCGGHVVDGSVPLPAFFVILPRSPTTDKAVQVKSPKGPGSFFRRFGPEGALDAGLMDGNPLRFGGLGGGLVGGLGGAHLCCLDCGSRRTRVSPFPNGKGEGVAPDVDLTGAGRGPAIIGGVNPGRGGEGGAHWSTP